MIHQNKIKGNGEHPTLESELQSMSTTVTDAADTAASAKQATVDTGNLITEMQEGIRDNKFVTDEVIAARDGQESLSKRLDLINTRDVVKSAMRVSVTQSITYNARGEKDVVSYSGDLNWSESYTYYEDDVHGDVIKRMEVAVDGAVVGFSDYTYDTMPDGKKRLKEVVSKDSIAILMTSDSLLAKDIVDKYNEIMSLNLDARMVAIEREVISGTYNGDEILSKVEVLEPRLQSVESLAFDSIGEIVNLPQLKQDIEAIKAESEAEYVTTKFIYNANIDEYDLGAAALNYLDIEVEGLSLDLDSDYTLSEDKRIVTIMAPILNGAIIECKFY